MITDLDKCLNLPIELRDKKQSANIGVISNLQVLAKLSSILHFAMKEKLANIVTAVVSGEIDYIFRLGCAGAKYDRASLLSNAVRLASTANTINIYGNKLNQDEIMRLLNLSAGASMLPVSEKKLDDILEDREIVSKYITSRAQSPEDSVNVISQALIYTGMGKIYNITEPSSLLKYMNQLMGMLSTFDSTERSQDPTGLCNYVALSIYLAASNEYENGLFTNKTTLTPASLYPAKAIAMVEYAHMFHAVAHAVDLAAIALQWDRVVSLRKLIAELADWRWSSSLEDVYKRVEASIAKMMERSMVLPFNVFSAGVSSLKQSLGVDMLFSDDMIPIPEFSEKCARLGATPVAPGESSLYLPLGEMSVLTEDTITFWFTTLDTLLRKTESDVRTIIDTLNGIQLNDDMKSRLRVEYPFASYPALFTPRWSSVQDQLPVAIGLRKSRKNKTRSLSPFINGIMSYRNVHDELAAEFSFNPRIGSYDHSGPLTVHPALLQFPIPSVYVRGENYEAIGLTDESLTSHMQSAGLPSHISYTKAVETLMFKTDPKYFAYHASLLSGAFCVIVKKTSEKSGVAYDTFYDGYSYVIPGIAPLSGALSNMIKDDAAMVKFKSENKPVSYGLPSDKFIAANILWMAKIIQAEVGDTKSEEWKRFILWSDDSFTFGLLPVSIFPVGGTVTPSYRMFDGRSATKQYEISTPHTDVMWATNVAWTNIFATLPQLTTSFVPSEKLTPIARRVGIVGRTAVTYVADVITRPSPEDMSQSPQPWINQAPIPAAPSVPDLATVQPIPGPVASQLPVDVNVETKLPQKEPANADSPVVPVETDGKAVVSDSGKQSSGSGPDIIQ
jgi:hypothetical protein